MRKTSPFIYLVPRFSAKMSEAELSAAESGNQQDTGSYCASSIVYVFNQESFAPDVYSLNELIDMS